MSGGSYDYLYLKTDNLTNHLHNLRRMRNRLEELFPATKALRDTEVVLELLSEAERIAEGLADVWHAIEWKDSGDRGMDQTIEVLVQYEQGGAEGGPSEAVGTDDLAGPGTGAPDRDPDGDGGVRAEEYVAPTNGHPAVVSMSQGHGPPIRGGG